MRYQRFMLRKPFEEAHTASFSYDLHTYFSQILRGETAELQTKMHTLCVTPRTVYTEFFEFAKETVWYGRRRGASVYSNKEISYLT